MILFLLKRLLIKIKHKGLQSVLDLFLIQFEFEIYNRENYKF